MRTFEFYAEKAIARYGLTGYNNLARELGINKASVSYLRSGKNIPSDDTMIKLAELAGMPKEEALIDLNLWRSKDKPEVQKIWQRLSKMIGCLLMVFGFSVLAKSAQCQDFTTTIAAQSLDIKLTLCDKFKKKLRSLLLSCFCFRKQLSGV